MTDEEVEAVWNTLKLKDVSGNELPSPDKLAMMLRGALVRACIAKALGDGGSAAVPVLGTQVMLYRCINCGRYAHHEELDWGKCSECRESLT